MSTFLYISQIQGVRYSSAPLTKVDMFKITIGLVPCEVKQTSK